MDCPRIFPRTPSIRLVICAMGAALLLGVPAWGSHSEIDGPIVNPVGPIELDSPDLPPEAPPIESSGSEPEQESKQTPTDDEPVLRPADVQTNTTQAAIGPPAGAESEKSANAAKTEPRPLPPQEASPLGVPSSSKPFGSSSGAGGGGATPGKGGWVKQTGAALGVVLGLIILGRYGLVALARRSGGLSAMLGAGGRAPSGVMEILARYPVSRGHTLVLLKVDRRVLVLCHTSAGFTTLTEFIEPEEVASILMRVRDEEGESMAARFSEMLHELSDQPVDDDGPVSPRIAIARGAEDDRRRWPPLRSVGGGVGGGAS